VCECCGQGNSAAGGAQAHVMCLHSVWAVVLCLLKLVEQALVETHLAVAQARFRLFGNDGSLCCDSFDDDWDHF
jgi:hypothetical protein